MKHRIENVVDRGEWRGTVYDLLADHLKSIHPNELTFRTVPHADHKLREDFPWTDHVRFIASNGDLCIVSETFDTIASAGRSVDVGDTFKRGE